MFAVDALLALILLALCIREVRVVRRLRGVEHRIEAAARSIYDPIHAREVVDHYRKTRGAA